MPTGRGIPKQFSEKATPRPFGLPDARLFISSTYGAFPASAPKHLAARSLADGRNRLAELAMALPASQPTQARDELPHRSRAHALFRADQLGLRGHERCDKPKRNGDGANG